jgi:hypothetical protein
MKPLMDMDSLCGARSACYNNLNQKSEHNAPTFDWLYYFDADIMRFFFFITSVPGMLLLRASCFTRRLCLATPLDGRLALVLTGVVSNCITPYVVLCVYFVIGFVFCPERANFISGFLTGISILDLKHGDKFIELHLCFIHFIQIVLNHQAPLGCDYAADQGPFFFEYRFVHDVILLTSLGGCCMHVIYA